VNDQQSQRVLACAFSAAAMMLWLAAGAHAGVNVRSVNTNAYPSVSMSVVTSSPSTGGHPRVTENGVPVQGLEAVNLGRSTTVLLAIDRSRSMAGQSIKDAASAADRFVTTKPRGDAIGVLAFGSRALPLTTFSTSTIDADGALRTLSVDRHSGTALYDAIVLGANELSDRTVGGRVLIVLTDGKDVSSKASLDEAVKAARDSGVAVYPIAIAGPEYTPQPLQQLASSTGGSFFRASDSGALADVYSRIASQLSRTWQVSYLTAARPGDALKLRVTVPGQGAAARDVQVPAGPGGAAASPGPSRLLPSGFYSGVGTLVVAISMAVIVLLGYLLVLQGQRTVWVKRRLDPHVSATRIQKRKGERFSSFGSLVKATERALGDMKQFVWLSRLLDRADLPLRAGEFAYIMLGSGFAFGLFLGVVTGSVLAFFIGLLAGGAAPLGFVHMKAKKRLRAFDNQLPDLLVTLAASLKAGHSFRQGIQSVVDEGMEPASREFKRVLTDTQLGRPMEDSLGEMAERIGSKNFTFVITAVTIQRQVGGSLAALFDMVAETVRARQQFARRIRALTAMGRASAYVLVGLPFVLAAILTLINRSFMAPLYHRHIGHMLIILGLGMMAIGSAFLKKIVSFKG
jgi:tight adherence protein B